MHLQGQGRCAFDIPIVQQTNQQLILKESFQQRLESAGDHRLICGPQTSPTIIQYAEKMPYFLEAVC